LSSNFSCYQPGGPTKEKTRGEGAAQVTITKASSCFSRWGRGRATGCWLATLANQGKYIVVLEDTPVFWQSRTGLLTQ
jgi:hypothetical protein